uniref:Self-incompatibility ribonuclease n=1 Tax=Petunia axillaris TaxID=33119 RepID=Q9AUD4_PETAX|nr:self-incompatibility ribonuclease [Petunia axillaris]
MLKSQLTSVLSILLLVLSPVYGYFEYFQLVLTWPPYFCHFNNCNRPTPDNFTVHGLWPDNWSKPLQNCDPLATIDGVLDIEKRSQLDERWPQLKHSKDDGMNLQPLWKGEYKKHGTCCNNMYNEQAYYDLAMNLKDRFDLLKILSSQGITPGKSYIVQKVQDAIRTVTHQLPRLKCVEYPGLELSEIVICFEPKGKNVVSCRRPGTCFKNGKMGTILYR